MASFELNFNSPKKTVTVSLEEEEGIFQLAYLFKKLLDEAGIKNNVTENVIETALAVEVTEEESN
jgi:hypothetical protein